MTYDKEKIYDLIPVIYRILDKQKTKLSESGTFDNVNNISTLLKENTGPLESFVDIISKEIKLIQDDIFDLYENQSIETCDEWVAPYIGDVIGSTYLSNTKDLPISRKSYIANTISYRRRKGTLLVLEKIAKDVTLWDAKGVEFFKILTTNQNLNHLRRDNTTTVDLRNREQIDLINTPFDTLTHNIDVRAIELLEGVYNVPNIGIYLYNTISFPVDNSVAYDHGNGQFSFNPFGLDSPLFNMSSNTTTAAKINQLNREINLTAPIRALELHKNLGNYYQSTLYQERTRNSILNVIADGKNIPIDKVQVCDLRQWKKPAEDKVVAIDPKLGRMTFNKILSNRVEGEEPDNPEVTAAFPLKVKVKCCYGFGSKVGGGTYLRPRLNVESFNTKLVVGGTDSNNGNFDSSFPNGQQPRARVYRITKEPRNGAQSQTMIEDNYLSYHPQIFESIRSAIEAWMVDVQRQENVLFRIEDNETYVENIINIVIPVGQTIMISASPGKRPVFVGSFSLKGEKSGSVIFDGLWICSPYENIISIEPGNLYNIVLNHCTILPQLFSNDFSDSTLLDNLNSDLSYQNSNDPQRPLFVWEEIPQDEQSCNRLVAFLKQNISDIDWLKNKDQITKAPENDNKIIIKDSTNPDNDLSIILSSDKKIAFVKRGVAAPDNLNIHLLVRNNPSNDLTTDVISYVYPHPKKNSIKVIGCTNRYLCNWEKLDSFDPNDNDAQILTNFVKENFSKEVKDFDFSSFASPSSTLQYQAKRDENNDKIEFSVTGIPDLGNPQGRSHKIKIRLLSNTMERTTAELFLDDKLVFDEFIIMRSEEDHTKNVWLDAGNDNLKVALDYSIAGQLDLSHNNLVIDWENIPPPSIDEPVDGLHNLINFIKSFFKIDLNAYVQDKMTGSEPDSFNEFLRGLFVKSSDVEITTSPGLEQDLGIKIVLRRHSLIDGQQGLIELSCQNNSDNDNNNKKVIFSFFSRKNAYGNTVIYYHSKNRLIMLNSILDGFNNDNDYALKGNDAVIENSTILGSTDLVRLKLASNSIFTDPLMVKRRQEGCIRYSYVPFDSFVPLKYNCYPEVENDKSKHSKEPIKPSFKSIRYGDPHYVDVDEKQIDIFEGAEDRSEMGCFYHLFKPQRLRDLRMVIEEYTRFGMKVGVFLK
ncbi:MAG: hypothetical protein R2685_15690 [Candidatus Nitrosocosmicus sp.]|nr:hypothetical protein [Candidatus Nitrosocosmicus sp.]